MQEVIYKPNIKDMIYEVRGVQVMLDSDLACLYQCKNGTKEINQAVRRNINKFPERYCFVLSNKESNFLVTICDQKNIETRGGKYKNPRVFTEEGIIMLASILKSDTAVNMSIKIVDTFVSMRKLISSNKNLLERIITIENNMDSKFLEYDKNFELLFK